jgi:serine/threonine protein kinase
MAGLIDNNQEHILEEAMQEFADAQSRGQEPDIDEFVRQYPELENQLRQRIRNIEKISALFDCLVQADENDFEEATLGQDLVGSQIGPYRLLSILSVGGMGIVYLAEQKHPIKRRVAIKVIKPGMDSKRVIARFEAERQALALMDHPNIAQVHDAGTTEAGRPYFVMEHVKGLPITEHCDQYKFTIEERLELFLQVCEAVQHAHQKGIIHRDIKPMNIMVSIEANKSVPKIIDFGIAKALSQPLTERTLVTEQGQMLGTPEYMSPEQVEMTSEDIDTRSDIYSLGVLLYELLTGVLPFESEVLRKGGISQVRKMICEEEPKTPSTRLSRLSREETTELAKSRRAEPGALQRRLRGDLDWITLRAMEKDRTLRYASVGEFGADIVRHLNHEPVVAGPPSTLYRVKKFVRRHKASVTGAAAVMAVLFGGIIVSVLFAARAEYARAEAQAVSDFLLNNVIESLSLWDVRGKEITVRSILDAASQSIDRQFADRPLVEASVRRAVGASYTFLGVYEPAERHFKRVFEIRRAELGAAHQETLISKWHIGWVYWWQGRYDEAEPLLIEALPGLERLLPEEHIERLYCMAVLAWLYNGQGRFSEAEQLFGKGLETVCRVLGEEHEYSPTFMQGLAFSYRMQGRYDKAERLFNKALELSRRVRGEQDFETLGLMNNLGELYRDQGRYDEAEQLLLKALDGKRNFLGEQHSLTLETMVSLARLYHSQGRYEQAESLFVKTMETAQAVLGDEHYCSFLSVSGLGTVYLSQGEYNEAESLLEKSLEIINRLLGEDHPQTLQTIKDFGVLRRKQQRHAEAEKLLMKALEGRQIKLGLEHPHTLESAHELAVLYKEQGRYDEAEQLLLEAVEGRRLKLGDKHPHTLESLNNLIALYEAWNKPEKANRWRAKLPQRTLP